MRSSAGRVGGWALFVLAITAINAFPEDRVVFPNMATVPDTNNGDGEQGVPGYNVDEASNNANADTNDDSKGMEEQLGPGLEDDEQVAKQVEELCDDEKDKSSEDKSSEDESSVDESCNLSENRLSYASPEGEMQCVQLTARGPCEENEWFVLRKPEANETDYEPEGVCVAKQCEAFYEVGYKGKCELLGEGGDCPRGMELLVNPFGEGECGCKEGLIPYEDAEGRVDCYHPFLQGPCEEGEQLLEGQGGDHDTGCVKSPCQESGLIIWKNEKCVKGARCEQEEDVAYDEELGQVSCVVVLRQLITIPERCPSGKSKDSSGDCIDSLDLKAENERPKRRLATNNRSVKSFLESRFG